MSKYSVKNIVLGIGIGLVISSIVNINASQQKLTIDDLQKEAERYNLKLVKNEIEKSYTDIEPTAIPQEQTEAETPQKEEVEQKEIITFKIKKGANSYTITDSLIEAGLIEDKQGFLDRLYELDKGGKLQAGTFFIEEGSDFDTIIKILTTIQ
jgi:hypothetical protein